MTEDGQKKELPCCVMQTIDRDAGSRLVIHERYVSLKADIHVDELVEKTRQALKEG